MTNRTKEEKIIIRYLLGQATEEECIRIEESYFQKPEYYEQVLTVEEELISNYVRGALSPSERFLFESHFLSSERRRKKYELTKDLAAYLSESYLPMLTRSESRTAWRNHFFGNMGGITIGRMGRIMAVVLVSIIGIVWGSKHISVSLTDIASLHVKSPNANQSPDHRGSPSEPRSSPTIAPQTQLQDQQPKPDLTEDPRPSELDHMPGLEARRSEARRNVTSTILGFSIDLAGLRDPNEITKVTIPSRTAAIQLNLSLGELEYSSYEIAIKTLEGKLVMHHNKVKPYTTRNGQILELRIPSKLLKDTHFVLDVSGIDELGEVKMLHESFFSVKRQ